ncbi:MAG: hypothetical protein U0269_38240 [Polyangiales bacterium]
MTSERLSAFDAFFVAYQRQAGIAMHLGLDVELDGALDRSAIDRAVNAVLSQWPALGAPLKKGLTGLHTSERGDARAIVRVERERSALDAEINAMIDPFNEPAMSVGWASEGARHRVVLRVHHAMMDGEGFAAVAMEFFAALGGGRSEKEREGARRKSARARPARSMSELLREKKARDDRVAARSHAMFSLGCIAPGPVSVVSESLVGEALQRARARAESVGVSPALWVIAAWARAAHAEVGRAGEVAIEVPVSVRAREGLENQRGNHIAPLVFFADAQRPIEQVARGMRASLRAAVERGQLEMDRVLSAPGAMLPWAVFERVAVNPTTTGNATTHVAAVRVDRSVRGLFTEASGLSLVRWAPFSPVCLKMGAALTVIQAPDEWAMAVTYRRNAMSESRAKSLLERAVAELG